MRRIGIFIVLLGCVVSGAWAQSPTTNNSLILYDNFNGPWIDPAKWYQTAETSLMLDALRELSPSYQGEGNNRRLHISARSYSWPGDDLGQTWGWFGLRFINEAAVKEISFDVVVNSAAVSVCQSHSDWSGTVGAQFRGVFFNTGDQSADGDNVEAGITLDRDGTNARAPLAVNAFYYKGDGSVGDTRPLGFVSLGKTNKLRMKWDQPNHQFVVQLNNNPEVFMGYYLSDTSRPTYEYKAIQVTPGTPNCTTTPPSSATMDTYIDNVYVNAP